MMTICNINRPDHKNPKKSKAERMRLREIARQEAITEDRRLIALRERDRQIAAAAPAIRIAREIAQLESELRSYCGFSAVTRRRLKPRITTIDARIAQLNQRKPS